MADRSLDLALTAVHKEFTSATVDLAATPRAFISGEIVHTED
jgi:hypothetical protein